MEVQVVKAPGGNGTAGPPLTGPSRAAGRQGVGEESGDDERWAPRPAALSALPRVRGHRSWQRRQQPGGSPALLAVRRAPHSPGRRRQNWSPAHRPQPGGGPSGCQGGERRRQGAVALAAARSGAARVGGRRGRRRRSEPGGSPALPAGGRPLAVREGGAYRAYRARERQIEHPARWNGHLRGDRAVKPPPSPPQGPEGDHRPPPFHAYRTHGQAPAIPRGETTTPSAIVWRFHPA